MEATDLGLRQYFRPAAQDVSYFRNTNSSGKSFERGQMNSGCSARVDEMNSEQSGGLVSARIAFEGLHIQNQVTVIRVMEHPSAAKEIQRG